MLPMREGRPFGRTVLLSQRSIGLIRSDFSMSFTDLVPSNCGASSLIGAYEPTPMYHQIRQR